MRDARIERRVAGALALGLVALSLWMYRPWEPRPFDTLDFSEFLPLLHGASGAWGRFTALTGYYVEQHGRLNLLSYAALAGKWTFLGDSPVRWQWARVVELLGLMALLYAFLRRLRNGPVAAVAGASVFIIGRVAGEGWTRMTQGEVLGTLCALGALHVALGRQTARRPAASMIAAGVLMAAAILAKEMLIGTLPLVLWVGLARTGAGPLGTPRFDRDSLRWGAGVSLLPLLAFLVALYVATHTAVEGFSTLYGSRSGQVGRFVELLLRPWFLTGQRVAPAALLAPGNALFLLALLAGVAAAWRAPGTRTMARSALGAAAVTSLSLAVLYVPWPYFNLYYAIPFLLATALLFAVAIEGWMGSGRSGPWIAGGAFVLICGATAPVTARFARAAIAQQQVDGELVTALARHADADTIFVARRTFAPLAWTGTGPTLRRYALATGAAAALPPAADISCPDAYGRMGRGLGRSILITYGHFCGALPGAEVTVVRRFPYLDIWWTDVSTAEDSIMAQLLVAPPAPPAVR